MPEASRLSIKLTSGDVGHRPAPVIPLTLDKLTEWIKGQNLDPYTTKGLIEMASRYPNAALPAFKKNFNLMLQRVRTQREKEQTGEIDAQSEANQNDQSQARPQEKNPEKAGDTSQANFKQRAEIV